MTQFIVYELLIDGQINSRPYRGNKFLVNFAKILIQKILNLAIFNGLLLAKTHDFFVLSSDSAILQSLILNNF